MTRSRQVRVTTTAIAAAVGTLLIVTLVHSTHWVNATFPGFFVMANRVVPSIALPDWLAVDAGGLFQHQVLEVNGEPTDSAAAVYARVAAEPPGTRLSYTLRAPDGSTDTVFVRSRRFGWTDWWLIFGAYCLNGFAFIATALVVFLLKPEKPASRGLLATGLACGLFGTALLRRRRPAI